MGGEISKMYGVLWFKTGSKRVLETRHDKIEEEGSGRSKHVNGEWMIRSEFRVIWTEKHVRKGKNVLFSIRYGIHLCTGYIWNYTNMKFFEIC